MDIDERLERLAERHEALTQTVELLTKDLSDMRVLVNDIAEGTVRLTKDFSDMKVLVNDIAEGTARLLHVAEIHEKRISRLEDQA